MKRSIIRNKFWVWGIIGLILIITMLVIFNRSKDESVSLFHIHGLGFTNDGAQLVIPAHDGLVSFTNDRWKIIEGAKHDYMGFNPVDTGFYSSGHPERGSNLKNPLGIVRSNNYGKTLEFLDFYGIEDFHGMAVGYNTHTIYLFNPRPNDKLRASGLYVSLDQTKNWEMSSLSGIEGNILSIAAHPTNEAAVAIGTSVGAYLSTDFGNKFDKLPIEQEVTAIAFGSNGDLFVGGKRIIFRSVAGEITPLSVFSLSSDEKIEYISQNPRNENEVAIATSALNVYISNDHGRNWDQIAKRGESLSIKSK